MQQISLEMLENNNDDLLYAMSFSIWWQQGSFFYLQN